MRTIEVQDIGKIIEKASNSSINLMFLGDTGIGKTQNVGRYAEENEFFLKTLILSQVEASEALGVPLESEYEYNGKKYKSLDTAIPKWVFELASKEKAILFLDEFLTAPPSVMNSFLNFLSEKKVQDIDLSHVIIIAATNIEEYTFQPSQNILSRFCMFYTINSTYNEYIGDDRIINKYEDKVSKTGILFDKRSLKPRCQRQLKDIATEDLPMFYEGFTNTPMLPVFSKHSGINDAIKSLAKERTAKEGEYYISDSLITSLSILLIKECPNVTDWKPKVSAISNIKIDKELLLSTLHSQIDRSVVK